MKKLQEISLFGALGAAALATAAVVSTGAAVPAEPTTAAPLSVQKAMELQIRERVASVVTGLLDEPDHDHTDHGPSCLMSGVGSVLAAPGTPPEAIEATLIRMEEYLASVSWDGEGEDTSNLARFQAGDRWGSIADRGTPVALTYSFPPDGIPVSGGTNVINADLTSIYGSASTWKNIFAQEFQRWADATGVTFTEVSDDGATWAAAPGPFNGGSSRGDIRIVMGPDDGPSNTLAFNFFPDNGDMQLDEAENWAFSNFLRNVVGHELGHAQGISHVCPANTSKLMEPFANGLIGPQFDDRLAAQFLYGDRFEPNNAGGTSIDLPALGLMNTGNPLIVEELSLHSGSDFDLMRFEALEGTEINVQVRPVGTSYLEGPQNFDGSCSAGTSFNSGAVSDLIVDILRPNFSTAATANSTAAGQAETIAGLEADTEGTWYVRVRSANSFSDAQMYEVTISTEGGGMGLPADFSGNGCVDATDLAVLISAWGTPGADITGDGTTAAGDLAVLIGSWTGSNCN